MENRRIKRVLTMVVLISILTVLSIDAFCAWDKFSNPGTGSWQYRKRITLSSNSASSITDYTVFLSYSQLGVSGLWSQSKLKSDCSDARFAYGDTGSTEFIYYRDDDASGFWVKITNIPSGNYYFYFYYGNNYASDSSNIANSFIWGDNFSTDRLLSYEPINPPGSGWGVSEGIFYWNMDIGDTWKGATPNNSGLLRLKNPVPGNYVAQVKILTQPAMPNQEMGLYGWTDKDNYVKTVYSYENSTGKSAKFSAEQNAAYGDIKVMGYTPQVIYLRLIKTDGTFKAKYSQDAIVWHDLTGNFTGQVTGEFVGLCADNSPSIMTAQFDNFIVRKTVTPEPAVSAVSAEEMGVSNPAKMILTATSLVITADGISTSLIKAFVCDSNSSIITTANNTLDYAVSGPGVLMGATRVGASGGSSTITLRSNTSPGTIMVSVISSPLSMGTVNVISSSSNQQDKDLAVTGIIIIPPTPVPGQDVTVQVKIKNQGPGNVTSPFWVDFYKNLNAAPNAGTAGDVYWEKQYLLAGSSDTLNGSFRYDGGNYNMYAKIDTENVISETIETNNVFSHTITGSTTAGTIKGRIKNALDNTDIKDAFVYIKKGLTTVVNTATSFTGEFITYVLQDTYNIEISAANYELKTINNVTVTMGSTVDLGLIPMGLAVSGNGLISGKITKSDGVTAISGATVEAITAGGGTVVSSVVTDVVGSYRLFLLPGVYDVRITKTGFSPVLMPDLTVSADASTANNTGLQLEQTGPAPVVELVPIPLADSKVRLEWKKSVSQSIAGYNVYYCRSNELDYSSLYGAVADNVLHPTVSWVSPELERGDRYYFSVRSVDLSGRENMDTNMVVNVAISNNPGELKAVIKVPQTGKKVDGDSLSVVADIIQGNAALASSVVFEYKLSHLDAWTSVEVPENTGLANPDTVSPYFLVWDISGLENGNYDLRAVVYDTNGNADPQPASIMVSKNSFDYDISEKVQDGWHVKEEKIFKGLSTRVRLGGTRSDKLTVIDVPEDALENSDDTIVIRSNEEAGGTAAAMSVKAQLTDMPVYGPLAGLASMGEYRDVELTSGQNVFIEGNGLTIAIPYFDADNDGLVDGLETSEDEIQVWSFSQTGPWQREEDFTIDTSSNIISVTTLHLSLFALYVPALAENLENVFAFPSPFRAAEHSNITFANLTGDVAIKVYNLAGELVYGIENVTEPFYSWNAVNNSNEPLASGVYIYVITDANNNVAKQKFSIIR